MELSILKCFKAGDYALKNWLHFWKHQQLLSPTLLRYMIYNIVELDDAISYQMENFLIEHISSFPPHLHKEVYYSFLYDEIKYEGGKTAYCLLTIISMLREIFGRRGQVADVDCPKTGRERKKRGQQKEDLSLFEHIQEKYIRNICVSDLPEFLDGSNLKPGGQRNRLERILACLSVYAEVLNGILSAFEDDIISSEEYVNFFIPCIPDMSFPNDMQLTLCSILCECPKTRWSTLGLANFIGALNRAVLISGASMDMVTNGLSYLIKGKSSDKDGQNSIVKLLQPPLLRLRVAQLLRLC